tara:strand:+ start:134 stop:421 length:288 start_codon:yes stop_codon:yes gene_type:complete
VVLGADARTARNQNDIGTWSRQHVGDVGSLVGDWHAGEGGLQHSPISLDEGSEHQRVGLKDLPFFSGVSRNDEFVAGDQQSNSRSTNNFGAILSE